MLCPNESKKKLLLSPGKKEPLTLSSMASNSFDLTQYAVHAFYQFKPNIYRFLIMVNMNWNFSDCVTFRS